MPAHSISAPEPPRPAPDVPLSEKSNVSRPIASFDKPYKPTVRRSASERPSSLHPRPFTNDFRTPGKGPGVDARLTPVKRPTLDPRTPTLEAWQIRSSSPVKALGTANGNTRVRSVTSPTTSRRPSLEKTKSSRTFEDRGRKGGDKPFSLWDYLLLELSATDHDASGVDIAVKQERVSNFLKIPGALEEVMAFGWLVCLDAFLYTFTILPLRFLLALPSLFSSLLSYTPIPPIPSSPPSHLKTSQKHDLLRFLLVLLSTSFLSLFDASKMYHTIRGQASIKLYVIFNLLEVADRLCGAIGVDVFDCLFGRGRRGGGESRRRRGVERMGFFVLGVAYNVLHAVVLFYQLVALNVAVNSYSNALLGLLLSNQFVEIKGSVFKKFEKENLFQVTCADIVERFQLTLMLLIIALRNTVELSASTTLSLPLLFDLLSPVLIVTGSEMAVDWLKHAFITKFNGLRPRVYKRYLDVLCRDYVVSENAFVDQSPAVARRIGFASLPLACVTIRAGMQVWSMLRIVHTSNVVLNQTGSRVDKVLAHLTSSDTLEAYIFSLTSTLLFFALLFACLVAVKLVLGLSLLHYAQSRYGTMLEREEEEREYERKRGKVVERGEVEVGEWAREYIRRGRDEVLDGEEKKTLWRLERWSMVSKRIW
ncbi:DUF747-domain-containing protein [Saitoella complicata NRRL Y-17804]|uniref:DUF747-domain-containing protein n=1 Tax=Saitoella complicata (strain BCRC 22490 / CBS 7301 / JCM 7358 / NBRC 10748 / NRRL Y-17804) TaxID=698492 RepID=UPI00086710FD|nr:DUF747-domain-containing protein [Saitoella complicata NRRL Y-17804]ODQ52604.1 DUF747-domain-containing protein [Saitoella complicata NRRL Y-17804]